jgi:hypothetical protein
MRPADPARQSAQDPAQRREKLRPVRVRRRLARRLAKQRCPTVAIDSISLIGSDRDRGDNTRSGQRAERVIRKAGKLCATKRCAPRARPAAKRWSVASVRSRLVIVAAKERSGYRMSLADSAVS